MRGSHLLTWPPSLLAAFATLVAGSTLPLAADPLRDRGLTRCLVWQGLSHLRGVARAAPALRPGWLPFSCLSPFPARWEMCSPTRTCASSTFCNKINGFLDFLRYPRFARSCAQVRRKSSTSCPQAAPQHPNSAVDVTADEEPCCKGWYDIIESHPAQRFRQRRDIVERC